MPWAGTWAGPMVRRVAARTPRRGPFRVGSLVYGCQGLEPGPGGCAGTDGVTGVTGCSDCGGTVDGIVAGRPGSAGGVPCPGTVVAVPPGCAAGGCAGTDGVTGVTGCSDCGGTVDGIVAGRPGSAGGVPCPGTVVGGPPGCAAGGPAPTADLDGGRLPVDPSAGGGASTLAAPSTAAQNSSTDWPAAEAAVARFAAATESPGGSVRAPNAMHSPGRAAPMGSGPTGLAAGSVGTSGSPGRVADGISTPPSASSSGAAVAEESPVGAGTTVVTAATIATRGSCDRTDCVIAAATPIVPMAKTVATVAPTANRRDRWPTRPTSTRLAPGLSAATRTSSTAGRAVMADAARSLPASSSPVGAARAAADQPGDLDQLRRGVVGRQVTVEEALDGVVVRVPEAGHAGGIVRRPRFVTLASRSTRPCDTCRSAVSRSARRRSALDWVVRTHVTDRPRISAVRTASRSATTRRINTSAWSGLR